MKTSKFGRNVLMVSLAGIMLLTFAYHVKYSQSNIRMDDLMRLEAFAPSAASQNILRTVKKAVAHDLNYLNQIFFYSLYKGKTTYPVGKFRIWDGLIAVLAVLMIYRVGRACGSKLTGVFSAAILALTPASLWGEHALRIFIVLLNFELFLMAGSKGHIIRWILWSAATVLLFSTGVFAEALLLQSWFFALLIILIFWSVATKTMPEWGKFVRLVRDARRKKPKSLWKKIRGDAGFSRYMATAIFVGIIVLALSVTGSFFLSSAILSVETFAFVILLSFGLIAVTSVVLFALPIFRRERQIVISWFVDNKSSRSTTTPYETFTYQKSGALLKMIFSYSAAVMLFLPLFFAFYKGINIFIDNCEFGRMFTFINESNSYYTWFLFALPFIFLIITVICYIFRFISRGRLIAAVALLVLSSIYIVQQRYAVISTPFYIICTAGIAATIVEMFSLLFVKQD